MPSGINLKSHVLAAKDRLAAGREKLKARHAGGTPAVQICNALADLLDGIVLDLFEAALDDLDPRVARDLRQQVVLSPHGGFGRRDVAPYSDVDLLVLHAPQAAGNVPQLATRLFRDINDVGLAVGNAIRTPSEACRMARGDAAICTTQIEARYLAGSVGLFSTFAGKLQKLTRWSLRGLLQSIERSRAEERAQYGETIFLLEPNIKRSRGGLRDLQLLRWIGYARYGTAEPRGLRLAGAITPQDYRQLQAASNFLLQLRNEMHFFAGRGNDVLDRAEQLRIAEVFRYEGGGGLLPVERFMQDYFRHTHAVSHIVSRFVDGARPHRWWQKLSTPLLGHQVEGDFWVGPSTIRATSRGLKKLQSDLGEVLRLADLANLYDKRIEYSTSEAIRHAAAEMPDHMSESAARRFLSLMDHPARLGEVLRELHEIGVLEKIIPPLKHARSLLQFNQYHKFTIDEHCLLAVEKATRFHNDPGPLGHVYDRIKPKRLLHLALLLHDLGKGHEEDHSDVGKRLAEEVGQRLGLSLSDIEKLGFLVHKHLVMSHLAFRRDTSDNELVVRFAVEVGSPDVLRMLFVLTAADLAAVGPGVLNDWKVEVLSDLYSRAMQHLSGDRRTLQSEDRLKQERDEIRAHLGERRSPWFDRQIDLLPPSYLHSAPPEQIARDLEKLHGLEPEGVYAVGRFLPDTSTVEYTVATHEDVTAGVFHKLAGALAAKGLRVLSAEINTLADGLVLDRFEVEDGDFRGEPPQERLAAVSRALADSLRSDKPPALHQARRYGRQSNRPDLTQLPTRVKVDNTSSDRYTIIDVFAADRTGLLYTISRTLFELGLSVSLAKIGTYLDQVVDVFYVTESQGQKIEDDLRVREIRERLLAAIETFEQQQEHEMHVAKG